MLAALLTDPGFAPRVEVEEAPEGPFELLLGTYDTNQNHVLTRVELASRDFTRLDRNRDGLVTLSDFPAESGELEPRIARNMDQALARATARRVFGPSWQAAFRALDGDSDRRLTRAEFEAAAPPRSASQRDAFAALLACVGSWDDDALDWVELDRWLSPE